MKILIRSIYPFLVILLLSPPLLTNPLFDRLGCQQKSLESMPRSKQEIINFKSLENITLCDTPSPHQQTPGFHSAVPANLGIF